ncbi:unnamed protein product [Cyclocybe aegerita]|uniref:Uncharacterized protein n=1 Tax=Cyclocybe aegerita TaxID=1973307 RepID=A0A8S0W963_CYCAE|nr:unnamed protein product [Cyclocybe aegerita]
MATFTDYVVLMTPIQPLKPPSKGKCPRVIEKIILQHLASLQNLPTRLFPDHHHIKRTMVDGLASDEAQMIALFLQAVFYGVYVVTFIQALTGIFSSKSLGSNPRLNIHWPTLAVTMLLFFNSTLNLVLGLIRIMQAYIYNVKSSKAIDQLGIDWINITKPFNVSVQILLADGMLVYRCWVVYSKSWKIIVFPILLWLLGISSCIWSLYVQTQLNSGSRMTSDLLYPLWMVFWIFTVSLNVYATVSIVVRIWQIGRMSPSAREDPSTPRAIMSLQKQTRSRLQAAIKIIVESGLIYTATSVTALASHVSKSHSIYITSAADIMAIGIAFNLIIIRIAIERSREHAAWSRGPVSTLKFGETLPPMPTRDSTQEDSRHGSDFTESKDVV